MIFLSALLRENVYDLEGKRIGSLSDVSVSLNETFPLVTGLVVHTSNGHQVIPWSQVDNLEEKQLHLSVRQPKIDSYTPDTNELLLKRDILDKQIVDTQGFRVVKVNDLKLAQIKSTARLIGVDISLSGLLRRLGILTPIEGLSKVLPIQLAERTVTWNYVEPIQVVNVATAQPAPALAGVAAGTLGVVPRVQLNVSHNKLADLRPADIADILEQLDVEEAEAVLSRLDDETAADALNEVETQLQSELLSELSPERASDLLEHLNPDDAADMLADIPAEEAERLLDLMPAAESRPIRDLLRYGQQTAGGLMNNEVLALSQNFTVEETLTQLRTQSTHLEMIYYLYIVDEDRHLKGVVSLRQLVTSDPATALKDLLDPDMISVHTTTDQEEVARIIAKYDLLAVPVIDENDTLVGMVTVDDVIDVIHEEQAEDFSEIAGANVEEFEEEEHFSVGAVLGRLRWMMVNIVAGLLLALVLRQVFGSLLQDIIHSSLTASTPHNKPLLLDTMMGLTPLVLLTSASVGSQALGVAGWQLRSAKGRDFIRGLFRELRLGSIGGILASIVVMLLSWLIFGSLFLGIASGVATGATLLIAALGGLGLPTLFQKIHLRGSLISSPFIDPLIAVICLCLFLFLTSIISGWLPY
ncbi:MAG TPA: magnesium transporter [Ktedonobacteraceae bacterium]|nr:magnesium transporter [Ktedonobacteraceae bacterium]